jgi:uncharacterized protein
MNLALTLDAVRHYSGVCAKQQLKHVLDAMANGANHHVRNGDDAAVIEIGGQTTLFAMEGFIPSFVAHDPWFAGWCGVMVNCSDIAAMGGTPSAVTNAIWSADDDTLIQLISGITAASRAYDVPVVGGHTCHNSGLNQLSVSIIGHARHVLTSFDACEGDVLICAIDLRGKYRKPFLNWDAATSAAPLQLKDDIALLPQIAAIDGVTGAKDISQAGILGTTTMFMDCSEKGIDIDLSKIPKPADVSWQDWLCTFPSFGYLISCQPDCVQAIHQLFRSRNIHSSEIGTLNSSKKVNVFYKEQHQTFFDLGESRFLMPDPKITVTKSEKKYARNNL